MHTQIYIKNRLTRKVINDKYPSIYDLNRSAIIYHKTIKRYDFGLGHPFRGERFPKYIALLENKNILSREYVDLLEPESAKDDDILLVHSKNYLERVNNLASLNGNLTIDTPVSNSIVDAARFIVGSALKAAFLVIEEGYDLADVVGGGLHHAGRDYGGGFCVFNDVAICAKTLTDRLSVERVMVFDTDVHAGNGTMDIFYEDSQVLFISLHQNPRTLYPGTGYVYQIGEGDGKGYTVNIPLPPGSGDKCIMLVLDKIFKPLVEQFRPNVIIRNGGPDAHFMDGLGSLNVTYNGFWRIGSSISKAAKSIDSPIINMSCSGYNPETVAKGMYAILSGLLGIGMDLNERHETLVEDKQIEDTETIIDDLSERLSNYWTI